ncbi:HTH domain-containing protein [Bradyrhizobium archetypum]|uniref:HTH HARE-type domain-containing protein n=1 Tax=Bradyrhizobium archetypum TaxID=2721160 RepID=A0A7Y4H2I8_9BRAD|nr:HTH domain-containing protein [Bradyrhizobium archetypum]NOJ46464.1 hypothetical protein [Bradyrhizobium archetypum]
MANFYLDLAKQILELTKRPLSAREMIDLARKGNLIPQKYASAKTPHKTIHARLAESIRYEGSKSPFYRFARGKFGLKSNLLDMEYRQRYAQEFKAPIRRKEISNETILCIPRTDLSIDGNDGFFATSTYQGILNDESLKYCPRKTAEKDVTIKQIVTYVAVLKERQVLCYERGSYSASGKEFIGSKSIGFGGHVSSDDFDLFSTDGRGVVSNAWRELREELNLTDKQIVGRGPTVVGIINDTTTQEGQKHIAVAMVVWCNPADDITKGELEIKNLHWKSIRALPNDLLEFEAWSKTFLRYLVQHLDSIFNAYRQTNILFSDQ